MNSTETLPSVALRSNFDLDLISQKIEKLLSTTDKAHDYAHIKRVRKLASEIAREEHVDSEMVDLLAILHEVGDRKVLPQMTLSDFIPDHPELNRLTNMIKAISWSSRNLFDNLSEESQKIVAVVSDADKLEALGAIGISRCLVYSGAHQCPILDDQEPRIGCSLEEYKSKPSSSAINHFFEKLLILDLSFKTPTGKRMARPRKQRMINYLLDLAEETQTFYPIKTKSMLHVIPECTYLGNTTSFPLDYDPEPHSLDRFISLLKQRYGATMTVLNCVGGRYFMVGTVLKSEELFELIWNHLPNPRVIRYLRD